MEQQAILILEQYEQLKVISDPMRTKMLMHLIEQPHTGQQLAQKLDVSRAKILYHLRELEKYQLIRLVKEEVRGGNVLKYYQAVARGFIPADHLLNLVETKQATRQSYIEVLDRAKTRVLTAPERSFAPSSPDVENWESLSLQKELRLTPEQFLTFTKRYRELLLEVEHDASTDETDQKLYYVMATAFEIEAALFEEGRDAGD
ncbi:DNA-binding transcriptional ArsR family regulator [Exiguobacterium sp. PvP048]|uniref:Transcriptional regulator, ArsR family n=1 Tax=Exiguobacterium sibiricum (strain DSM 17290 / CCUG 55495 / CIP 109462 / JCM 13490 / 255-15) TaxID=262543 RepID=B1YGH6_EXIS2|nr:winged helix-turn-helix domain-containing protein [Exiguobacterium sibiricum]ACB60980.1 transcriptional regulator, ArsR family [Exiguobacterium sibiricum 255-15]